MQVTAGRTDVVAVAPRRHPDGGPLPTALPRPTPTSLVCDSVARLLPRLRRRRFGPPPATVSDGWVVGGEVDLDPQILAAVGGLDPRYRTALGIADLCERIAVVSPHLRLGTLPGPAVPDPLSPPDTSHVDWFSDVEILTAGRPGLDWKAARLVLRLLRCGFARRSVDTQTR